MSHSRGLSHHVPLCWAFGPGPVEAWVGRFDYHPPKFSTSPTPRDLRLVAEIAGELAKARVFLTIRPNGPYALRGENLPDFVQMVPSRRQRGEGGGYEIIEGGLSERPKPLNLSKDGRRLSFRFSAGQAPICFVRR